MSSPPTIPTRGRYVKAKQLARYEAADSFVKFLHFMIQLGQFETISMRAKDGPATRKWFGERLQPWEDIVYPEKVDDE